MRIDTDVMVRMRKDLYEIIRRIARIRGKHIKLFVNEIVAEYIKQIPSDEKKIAEQMIQKADKYNK